MIMLFDALIFVLALMAILLGAIIWGLCKLHYAKKDLDLSAKEADSLLAECQGKIDALTSEPINYGFQISVNGTVMVYAYYKRNVFSSSALIKSIHFDPTDAADQSLAVRDAEEIIEKLKEI